MFETEEEDCVRVIRKGLENIESLREGALATAQEYSIQNTAIALEKLYQEVIEAKRNQKD